MIRFVGASVALVAVILGVFSALQLSRPSYFIETLILLAVTTVGIYSFLLKARAQSQFTFVQLYLLTITIKLTACLAYCVIIVWKDRAAATENMVFFLIVYSLFTALEVGFLWKKIQGV